MSFYDGVESQGMEEWKILTRFISVEILIYIFIFQFFRCKVNFTPAVDINKSFVFLQKLQQC